MAAEGLCPGTTHESMECNSSEDKHFNEAASFMSQDASSKHVGLPSEAMEGVVPCGVTVPTPERETVTKVPVRTEKNVSVTPVPPPPSTARTPSIAKDGKAQAAVPELSLDIQEAASIVKTKETSLIVKGGVKSGSKGEVCQAVAQRSEEPSGAVGGIPLPPIRGKQKGKDTAGDVSVISDSDGSLPKDLEKVRRNARPTYNLNAQLLRPGQLGTKIPVVLHCGGRCPVARLSVQWKPIILTGGHPIQLENIVIITQLGMSVRTGTLASARPVLARSRNCRMWYFAPGRAYSACTKSPMRVRRRGVNRWIGGGYRRSRKQEGDNTTWPMRPV